MATEHEGSPRPGWPVPPSQNPKATASNPVKPRSAAVEWVAKWAAGGLLVLALMALCFGFGYGFRMATEGSAAGFGDPTTQRASGAPDFAVLNEIYGDIKKDYIDSDKLDAASLREGAIDGLIKAVGDAAHGLPQSGHLPQRERRRHWLLQRYRRHRRAAQRRARADAAAQHCPPRRPASSPTICSFRSTGPPPKAGTSCRPSRRFAVPAAPR